MRHRRVVPAAQEQPWCDTSGVGWASEVEEGAALADLGVGPGLVGLARGRRLRLVLVRGFVLVLGRSLVGFVGLVLPLGLGRLGRLLGRSGVLRLDVLQRGDAGVVGLGLRLGLGLLGLVLRLGLGLFRVLVRGYVGVGVVLAAVDAFAGVLGGGFCWFGGGDLVLGGGFDVEE